ncbi:MAG: hypothetical protein ACOH1T_02165 [Microbacteriaceae bacterium]
MSGIEFREYPPRPVRLHPAILLWGIFGGAAIGATLYFMVLGDARTTLFGRAVSANLVEALSYGAGAGLACGLITLLARWIAWAIARGDRFDGLASAAGALIGSGLVTALILAPLGGDILLPHAGAIAVLAAVVFALVARKARAGRRLTSR